MIEPAYQQNRLHICGQDERIEKRRETVKLVKNTFKAFAKFVNVTYEKLIFQQKDDYFSDWSFLSKENKIGESDNPRRLAMNDSQWSELLANDDVERIIGWLLW